ncbi:MAG: hypothetical protein CEN88_172 [Candidatus Berkelbacteria bacterium Licking1014_2]|uniref:Peptidase M48 domain-containing protein n=1 Tax=Candidatus Berkelbacteria bacterium Licking1014_2 TaxID=2017146 RepID=A0A554LW84_9BACT|nr:MAG: hypothetical protein CEN88_172 [Candidatus Berkelbacteria bacterium Licking1014_2]
METVLLGTIFIIVVVTFAIVAITFCFTGFPPAHGAGLESQEQRLQRISSRLTTANNGFQGVDFQLENNKEINAMAGNGRIIVYSGLMTAMSDDEVAWVLSHELSHFRSRDDRKAGATAMTWDIIGRVAEEKGGQKVGLIARPGNGRGADFESSRLPPRHAHAHRPGTSGDYNTYYRDRRHHHRGGRRPRPRPNGGGE